MNQQDKDRLRELADLCGTYHSEGALIHTHSALGIVGAFKRSEQAILSLLEENEALVAKLEAIRWPKDTEEVRRFMRHHCEVEQWGIDEHTASDDDRYQLTSHDFLSAADWWTDFLNRDTDAAMQHKGD